MKIYIQRIRFGEDGRLPLSRFYQLRKNGLMGSCAYPEKVHDPLISEKPGERNELTRSFKGNNGKNMMIHSGVAFFGPYGKGEVIGIVRETTTSHPWLGGGEGYGTDVQFHNNEIIAKKSRSFGEVLLVTEREDEILRLQRFLNLSDLEKMFKPIIEREEKYPTYWDIGGF